MWGRARRRAITPAISSRRRDIDANRHVLRARAQHDAVDRRDFGIIAADRHDDMVARHPDAVGRIEPDPAAYRPAPQQRPGVRRIRPHQPRLSRRRNRADIARGIGRGQTGGAQAGDHDLCEILTDAAALIECLARGRVDQRGGRVEFEFVLDALCERDARFERRAVGREIGGAIIGDLPVERDQRRRVDIRRWPRRRQVATVAGERRDFAERRVRSRRGRVRGDRPRRARGFRSSACGRAHRRRGG